MCADLDLSDAVHDSVVCVACGRFGGADAAALLLDAAGSWLRREETSFGRGAGNVANILHAAAKLRVDIGEPVLQALLRECAKLSRDFNAQDAATGLLRRA
jgi:hypothetical protein